MRPKAMLCAALVGAGLLAAGGCNVIEVQAAPAVEGAFERTLAVSGPAELDIRTGSGDIQVRAGTDNAVHVTGHVKVRDVVAGEGPQQRLARIQAAPPITLTGNTVRVGNTNDIALYRNVSISYEVALPAGARIQAHTGSGNIGVAMNAGGVDARTGSGNINVLGASSGFEAHTGSGDVHAGRVAGPMKAETGSGNIQAQQTSGGAVDMRTGSGNVSLKLAPDSAFDLNVHTGSGAIHTTHPLASFGSRSRNRLEGSVRGGGTPVQIRTGSGDVTID